MSADGVETELHAANSPHLSDSRHSDSASPAASSTPAAPASPGDLAIAQAVAALDVGSLIREFNEQGDFIFVPRFLSPELVAGMQAEYRGFSTEDIHRVFVPFIRKAGTIGHAEIAARAPLLYALYRAPAMLALATRLAGAKLELKNDVDAHAAALYVYQRRGDHVGFHYDDCGCEGMSSYTATFGILNDTKSEVHFQLFLKDPARPMKELRIAMTPGSFVFFRGAKAYHRVTPIEKGDERVAYSFAYVREGNRLRGYRRFTENIKDALLYFGPKAIFQKNYR